MKKENRRTIDDAPQEFWELMDQESIYSKMAAGLLESDRDLNDNLAERAYNYMRKSQTANRAAWKIILEAYPDTAGHQMTASPATRKIHVQL